MAVDLILARKIIDYLNDFLERDRDAIQLLMDFKAPASPDHPFNPATFSMEGNYFINIFCLLNGLCGSYSEGVLADMGPISMSTSFDGTIQEFSMTEGGDIHFWLLHRRRVGSS